MTNLAHTPGPWALTPASLVIGADGKRVCQIPVRLDNHDVGDAHLIAAAPELLEVLCLTLPLICEAQEALCGNEACTDADGNDALQVIRGRIASVLTKATSS